MMESAVKKKWDRFSMFYKLHTSGAEKRWKPWKRDFFSKMGEGKILFLAVGIGSEIRHFPEGRDIVGIDISTEMLKKAGKAASNYSGKLELKEMDAQKLSFEDDFFDQIFTSCTFCSVPEPVVGLKELKRVLKPGGELWMFEHTISNHFPFRQMLTMMNPVAEKIGPSLNRNTILNVTLAGFVIKQIFNIYLDVVKTIHAVKPKA
jgi:ubiquinone/menaquinone biosynthesis C-methylase UbiE